ncbi:hypothetical protein D3C87_1771320 [compost metagenome]
MQTDGIEFDLQVLTLDRAYHAFLTGTQYPRGHLGRIVGAHVAGEDDGAAEVVLAVGVELADHRLTEFLGDAPDH